MSRNSERNTWKKSKESEEENSSNSKTWKSSENNSIYELDIVPKANKKFLKLDKKNKKQLKIILKKIDEILENPYRYKPLKNTMFGERRVHIDSSFVLTYELDGLTVRILDFDHHDKIYK